MNLHNIPTPNPDEQLLLAYFTARYGSQFAREGARIVLQDHQFRLVLASGKSGPWTIVTHDLPRARRWQREGEFWR